MTRSYIALILNAEADWPSLQVKGLFCYQRKRIYSLNHWLNPVNASVKVGDKGPFWYFDRHFNEIVSNIMKRWNEFRSLKGIVQIFR